MEDTTWLGPPGKRSFSAEVKQELAEHFPTARHCQLAELAALLNHCAGLYSDSQGAVQLVLQTENETVARKCFTILQKTFNIEAVKEIQKNLYRLRVSETEDAVRILEAVKFWDDSLVACEHDLQQRTVDNRLIGSVCCRRAFLRGAFLASGSVSDPRRFYHFEIACLTRSQAELLQEVMRGFSLDAKIVIRKRYHVVYLKEGDQIVDCLNLMEAHRALMQLENIRIFKDMRNSINRQVNCEAANIHKTVSAAVQQTNDILYIRDTMGLESLPESLQEIALARLTYPEASLTELGALLSSPVGKSGVNHRLRRLKQIADERRGKEGG